MDRKQTYTVAGHSFCFVNEEHDPMWERMAHQYGPFVNNQAGDTLFTVTVCDELPKAEHAHPVHLDPNPNSKEAKINVCYTPDGYQFELTSLPGGKWHSQLHISTDKRSARLLPCGDEADRFCGVNTSLMLCYLLATVGSNTALLHASAVVSEGKSYLFLGRRGTGKSTHSDLWRRYIPGTELLNDERPILRIDDQGRVIAYGSPWSRKTPCYRDEHAPVGGIVRIKQAKENQIRRLSPQEAYTSLVTSCSGMSWNIGRAEGKHNTLRKVITSVPCYLLGCLPDREAAELCARTVRKE